MASGTNNIEGFDILDIIREFGRENKEAIKAAAVTIRDGVLEARSSAEYITSSLKVNVNSPIVLLGYDRARVRALVRTNSPGIYIGSLQQLSGGLGYLLGAEAGGEELKTYNEVWVTYLPDVPPAPNAPLPIVSVWAERRP